MQGDKCVVKKITSTGAATNVSLGFTPIYAVVENETTGKTFQWWGGSDGDAAGDAIQTVWATGVKTKITSNGIDAYTGATGSSEAEVGLTLGSTVVGTTADVIRLVAWRGYQDA